MLTTLKLLCQVAQERDPAARSKWEILLCYPTVWALFFHGFSHFLWKKKRRILARMLSNFMRFTTGVEIHPGASIGKGVFIDHGMGIVIGETARVGDNVTIYHGVTLGGVMPAIDSSEQRDVVRHPDIKEGVIIGSGAQILGTVEVGSYARIGANAVVTKNVKPGAVMVGIPAKQTGSTKKQQTKKDFTPYGLVENCQSDGLEEHQEQIEQLTLKVAMLEQQIATLLEKENP